MIVGEEWYRYEERKKNQTYHWRADNGIHFKHDDL